LPASDAGIYAVVDAELYPVDREPISGGTVVIRDGRIAAIGQNVEIPENAQVIKATGLHVYPGLFDPGTTLGLTEIGRVNETNDYSESGDLQPDLRAGVAINPDSELFPVARSWSDRQAV
jgi:imidazolonepropionase-like amidohydrolase